MKSKQRILIVDDDVQLCELLTTYFVNFDYDVSVANDGKQMFKILKNKIIDLIVLDFMLPGEDGLILCRKIRETSAMPIIMLSAVGDETDRVLGLEIGADDYLPKPFSQRELLARIKSLLRRTSGAFADEHKSKQLTKLPKFNFLNWTLEMKTHRLIAPDNVTVPLSHGEYELLIAFIENTNRVLSRDQLLDLTSSREASAFDRSIDVQVARLRKKMEEDPKQPKIIVTVRGGGYQFIPKVTQS